MKRYFLTLILLLICGAAFADDGYVRLAIKGTEINLREEPGTDSDMVAKANTGDVFIAEKWPIVNVRDKKEWYRIVLAVDAKTGKVSILSEWNSRFELNEGYVRSDLAVISPLAEGDMEKIMATPTGVGYSFDIDPNSAEFGVMTKDNFYFFSKDWNTILRVAEGTDIYDKGVINDKSAKVTGRFNKETIVRLLGTNPDETMYKVMDVTGKNLPGYVDANKVNRSRLHQEKNFDFEAHMRFCELYIGANIAEIVRKWGVTEVERIRGNIYEAGYFFITSIKAPGVSVYYNDGGGFGMVMEFEINREGAGIGGIYIGADWCGEGWVRKLMGEPHKISGNVWTWHYEDDNDKYDRVWIRFENGLVTSFRAKIGDYNLIKGELK